MPKKDTGVQGYIVDDVDEFQEKSVTLKDKVSDTATQAKDKVSEYGRAAVEKIDENRESAAGTLDSAASAIHQKADGLPGGETVTGMAHTAADKLTATADYVRQHDVQAMMTDVENLVRRHPGQALMAAAAVGFLVGRAFRND